MKKRNLRPQQTAPVARETYTINTNNSFQEEEKGIVPQGTNLTSVTHLYIIPFAGDDAE